MSAQFNYHNQNFYFIKFNPLLQNSFNSIESNNSSDIYNNFNNTLNYNDNLCKKNNRLVNPNERNSNQKNDIFNKSNENEYSKFLILTKEIINKILSQLNCCICKICQSNGNNEIGFFCKIPFANSILPVLITNNHVLNKDDIRINRIVKIALIVDEKEKEKEKEIQIVINEQRITFTDKDLDVTIIEIIPKVDGINDFLEIDDNFDQLYLNQKIYILQYSKGEASFSIGNLRKKSEEYNLKNFLYSSVTSEGSLGAPILNFTNYKVIGVHKGSKENININIGTIMKYLIYEFEKTYDINKSKLNLKEKEKIKGTKIKPLNNNEYYVGNLKNGKISIYYSNGKLKYEGDSVDGNFEGKGTYYYEGGNCYEGEWKRGLKHGKGKLYYNYESYKIQYEGNFSKGNFEGKGIYYWKDGSYYIGDFVNGSKHGYGTYYVKGGKIKYEGGFANDKFEGNGIYYCNNDNYYIGGFKNGLKHGEGILYNKNGNIIVKGKFVNNQYEDI